MTSPRNPRAPLSGNKKRENTETKTIKTCRLNDNTFGRQFSLSSVSCKKGGWRFGITCLEARRKSACDSLGRLRVVKGIASACCGSQLAAIDRGYDGCTDILHSHFFQQFLPIMLNGINRFIHHFGNLFHIPSLGRQNDHFLFCRR